MLYKVSGTFKILQDLLQKLIWTRACQWADTGLTQWATPVVSVVKNGPTDCICGDSKITPLPPLVKEWTGKTQSLLVPEAWKSPLLTFILALWCPFL